MAITANEWSDVKPGDFITLDDKQTIMDLMERKHSDAMTGLEAVVESVKTFKEQNNLATWTLYDLDCNKGQDEVAPLWLLVKRVDSDMDFRVYYRPDDFAPGDRADLLDRGLFWLFEEPANADDFIPCELNYNSRIEQDLDDGTHLNYELKHPPLYCELTETPRGDGVDYPVFASIAEYIADKDCENPELLIYEIGGLDEDGDPLDEGGFVQFLQGANINPSDLSITRA